MPMPDSRGSRVPCCSPCGTGCRTTRLTRAVTPPRSSRYGPRGAPPPREGLCRRRSGRGGRHHAVRLFVAFDPSAEVRDSLLAALGPTRDEQLRWVPAEQWHLTLA